MGNLQMSEEDIRELISSLAWYDCSAYHVSNVKRILHKHYSDSDFDDVLELFRSNVTMTPGEGCPR